MTAMKLKMTVYPHELGKTFCEHLSFFSSDYLESIREKIIIELDKRGYWDEQLKD